MFDLNSLIDRASRIVESAKQEQREREGPRCESVHVGVLDERGTFRVTYIDRLGPFPGQWGDRWGYIFHEEKTCNVMMWWTTTECPLEKGETAEITATVAKHDVYSGTNQTVVNRVKRVDPAVQAAKARKRARDEEEANPDRSDPDAADSPLHRASEILKRLSDDEFDEVAERVRREREK